MNKPEADAAPKPQPEPQDTELWERCSVFVNVFVRDHFGHALGACTNELFEFVRQEIARAQKEKP